MRVSDILKDKGDRVITVRETMPLSAAVRILHDERIGALVIDDNAGGLLGVVSEREVVSALAQLGAVALHRPLREIMINRALSVAPADPVLHAMRVMTEQRARHLPVVEAGKVVGLLSLGDVVKSRLAEKQQENLVLQDMARWPHAA